MNRQQRRNIAGSMGKLVSAISREKTWEQRWLMYAGSVKMWLEEGQKRGLNQNEILSDLGGELARRLVNHFDSAPIGDAWQAMLYRMSSDDVHQAASDGWQLTHQQEMLALQEQCPGLEFAEPTEDQTGGYMLNLRQTIYLIATNDELSPPPSPKMIALRRLSHALVDYYQTGRLVGDLEKNVAPHDARRLQIEVFASFLRGRLKPANTEAELAVADLIEQTERESDEGLRMLYMLAGRSYRSAEI